MSFIILKNRQTLTVSATQGATIWQVTTGERKGTKQQKLFVKRIERIYLSHSNAPESYRLKYPKAEPERMQVRLPYRD